MSRAPYRGGVTTTPPPARRPVWRVWRTCTPDPTSLRCGGRVPCCDGNHLTRSPNRPERRRGGRPPLGAPAEGYGPRFPRVGAVAASSSGGDGGADPVPWGVPPDTMTSHGSHRAERPAARSRAAPAAPARLAAATPGRRLARAGTRVGAAARL